MYNEKYKKRIIDSIIAEYLDVFGVIVIEGPKWCGKTWTGANALSLLVRRKRRRYHIHINIPNGVNV